MFEQMSKIHAWCNTQKMGFANTSKRGHLWKRFVCSHNLYIPTLHAPMVLFPWSTMDCIFYFPLQFAANHLSVCVILVFHIVFCHSNLYSTSVRDPCFYNSEVELALGIHSDFEGSVQHAPLMVWWGISIPMYFKRWKKMAFVLYGLPFVSHFTILKQFTVLSVLLHWQKLHQPHKNCVAQQQVFAFNLYYKLEKVLLNLLEAKL